jgi:hypothetical protein
LPDLEHPSITQVNKTGYANMAAQPEHAGIDFYDTEILEGDRKVIDPNNGAEILVENLERYLAEEYGFEFKQAE